MVREIIFRDVERWFLLAFLAHFALVGALYVLLTIQRQRAVRAGTVKVGDFVRANADPALSARVQRNLSNQFEAPVFAYFAAAVLLWAGAVSAFDVAAARDSLAVLRLESVADAPEFARALAGVLAHLARGGDLTDDFARARRTLGGLTRVPNGDWSRVAPP